MNVPRCGCVNELHPPTGASRCVSKCVRHRRLARDPATLGEAYYRDLGLFGETAHIPELLEALGPFPACRDNRLALEVGCGCSPYAGAIKAAGWRYLGLDASPFAARWTAARWGVATAAGPLGSLPRPGRCGLILAAHVIEHFDDAPAAIARLAEMLNPGGELWVVIPDDSDPCNPDHLWFFTEASLRRAIELAGLVVARMRSFRRIACEEFIYCRAVKP